MVPRRVLQAIGMLAAGLAGAMTVPVQQALAGPPAWKSLPVVESDGELSDIGGYTVHDPAKANWTPPEFSYDADLAARPKLARVIVFIYNNMRSVLSYADNWLSYPDVSGLPRLIGSEAWDHAQYGNQVWWLAHIPKAPGYTKWGYNHGWIYIANVDEDLPDRPIPAEVVYPQE